MHEIECKLHLSAPNTIVGRLEKLGAEYHGEVFEKNWVFDRKGELGRKRELLRLRVTDENTWGILAHKRPATEGSYKVRVETETRVESAENTRTILESLGYKRDWYYEKRRRSWEYSGCEIVIDQMPRLGYFIEIEAQSDEIIDGLLKLLGLNKLDNLRSNYRQLWFNYCEVENLPFADWKF